MTTDHEAAAADLIRDADAAMYRAKEAGGGRWSMFDQIVRDRAVARQAIEAQLRSAITNDELVVHFQPELAVSSGAVVGVEALVRWNRPGVGMVSPADFIPIAEETGLIVPIGAWVMREACLQAMRQFDDGQMVIRVNVSARQLTEPGLIDTVTEALSASGLAPERLCLEVTESVVLEDGDRCVTALRALRDIGVSVSLDDFGTGYCSLSYLRRLPIDSLKIDRSFVRGLGSEADDDSIVTSVIDLARSLGVSVVAEGVETEEQLAGLRARGCDTMQGFLFARPGPAADVAALVGERDAPIAA
jgi:EAL domain-containing protein (putative c-di-GMP-specific phosphodiesterase class I)